MEPIHEAALDGDVAAIERLVAEDGRRLNAQIQGDEEVDGEYVKGCSPLLLAAWEGHDAAVARLLALGADVGLKGGGEYDVVHWACWGGDHSSVLALLLDAGASFEARTRAGSTPLIFSIVRHCPSCATLLITRGGKALDLDAQDEEGRTALSSAAFCGFPDIVQLLLQAGADPTIRDDGGGTALDSTRFLKRRRQACISLLRAALIELQRTRLLFKARALLDAAHATKKARTGAQTKGHTAPLQQQAAIAAAPVYLKQRVAQAQELPRVSIHHQNGDEEWEELAACVKYALGLEGGGGVVFEGQEPTVGMLPEVFAELLEMMVPKWDPARKGRVLGEGYNEVPEEGEGEASEDDISELSHEDTEYDIDMDKFGNY